MTMIAMSSITLRMPRALYRVVSTAAYRSGMTMTTYMQECFRQGLLMSSVREQTKDEWPDPPPPKKSRPSDSPLYWKL